MPSQILPETTIHLREDAQIAQLRRFSSTRPTCARSPSDTCGTKSVLTKKWSNFSWGVAPSRTDSDLREEKRRGAVNLIFVVQVSFSRAQSNLALFASYSHTPCWSCLRPKSECNLPKWEKRLCSTMKIRFTKMQDEY